MTGALGGDGGGRIVVGVLRIQASCIAACPPRGAPVLQRILWYVRDRSVVVRQWVHASAIEPAARAVVIVGGAVEEHAVAVHASADDASPVIHHGERTEVECHGLRAPKWGWIHGW